VIEIERVARIMREVASQEIMPRWRNLAGGDVVEKSGPSDVVTVADRAAEVELSRRLAELIAGSRVIGEEGVHADPSVMRHFGSGDPVWVIDPIDGTSAFAKGERAFAVMVALVRGEELLAGWILAPASGELHMGERGSGVWRARDGEVQRLMRPDIPTVEGALIGLLGRRNMSDARRAAIKSRGDAFGALENVSCAGLDYPRLLAGSAHFAIYNKSEPWDHLAGLTLASELGFVYSKHDGSAYRPGDNAGGLVIAPSVHVAADIRRQLLSEND
jgi:fructose-1,6-bisphosphatase/inositol monophosphatase family enzyme